eukprot:3467089-Ditylum_brightwellii.AAC.1
MSPQTLYTCVCYGLSVEFTQTLKNVPTQGQRVNSLHPANSKGTHKGENGGSVTPCWEGKTGGPAIY